MSWKDRIGPASYTSPSGRKINFLYEDVSRQFTRHTVAFDFPDVDGTFIQDLGRSGRRFPLRVFFSGEDYDEQANTFDSMLEERGVGILEHPQYGPTTFRVVPFGAVTRRDNLKTGGNQAVFEVTFWETTDILFPTNTGSPGADTKEAVDEFLAESPADFADKIDEDTTVEAVAVRSRYRKTVDDVNSRLRSVAEATDSVLKEFDAVFASINSDLDTAISTPLTLASQIGTLAQLPARGEALIQDEITAYGDLLTSFTSLGTVYDPQLDSVNKNKFRNDDLFSANMLMGAVTAVLETEFTLKTDALVSADLLLAMGDEWNAWRDDNLVSLSEIDTGENYQQVSTALALAAGFLVEISFSLKQERVIILERARTIINLAASLYKSVEDADLDFLITTNDFAGEEILEVPKGRRVVYYV